MSEHTPNAEQQQPYQQQPYQQQPYQQYPQQPYQQPYSDPNAKSRIVAGLLGIFLGGLGMHRFYLGYTKIGVIQIIASVLTFGAAGIWGFVEGILYLVSKEGTYSVDAEGRPLAS